MLMIRISSRLQSINYVEASVKDLADLDGLFSNSGKRAHRFHNGDVIFVEDYGESRPDDIFRLGSGRFGFKTLYGDGFVVHVGKDGKLYDVRHDVPSLVALVRFRFKQI